LPPAPAPRAAGGADEIMKILGDKSLEGARVAIVIRDLDARKTIFELNPGGAFIPASNMKLVTAAGALLGLGLSWRFHTDVFVDGTASEEGVVKNLYVLGRGDPTLSGKFSASDGDAIRGLAGETVRLGVREITGDIVLDDTYFPPQGHPSSWQREDTAYCYAPLTGALSIAGNCLRGTVRAPKSGKAVEVETNVPLDPALVKTRVVRVWRGASSVRVTEEADGSFLLSGKVRVGGSAEFEHPVKNPDLFFGNALAAGLEERGVAFRGKVIRESEFDGDLHAFKRLFRASSPELTAIIEEMERESDNFAAEQLLRTIGAVRGEAGSTSAGAEATVALLEKYKIAPPGTLTIDDGSGLSRRNALAPQVLTNVLEKFYHSFVGDTFMESLAAPGAKGTLRNRLVGTAAEGNLWAKTGAIRGACSLSGYYRRKNGGFGSFVMLFNGYKVHSSHIRGVQDRIVKVMMEM
ncbi:MAG: D-alanyl-D-alanine carboxypeptidase/D-alanyl-D-alanine-endopeptidase, partial [bacterium]